MQQSRWDQIREHFAELGFDKDMMSPQAPTDDLQTLEAVYDRLAGDSDEITLSDDFKMGLLVGTLVTARA